MIVLSKISFSIDGVTYAAKEHVLGKEVTGHWYFQALVKDGSIEILKDDEEPKDIEEVIVETDADSETVDEEPKEAPQKKGKK